MAAPTTDRPRRRGARHLRRNTLVVMATVVAVAVAPTTAFAAVSATPDPTAKVNGPVFAVAQVGDLTVIGGRFTTVGGQPRSNVAAIRADGTVDPTFNPTVNGDVLALAGSSDATRVFIGGVFTSAGGAARANLAAVEATSGAAVPTWQADTVGAAPDVLALAVHGTNLYVAGRYSGIDDAQRRRLAAIDTTTGDVVTGFRPAPNGILKAVAVSADGSKVYAGGSFTEIGGQVRLNSVAELLASTGEATSFNPSLGGGRVVSLGLSPDGTRVYSGTENNTVFAYELATGVPAWSIKMSGNTQAIAVSESSVYLGGHFSQSVTEKTRRIFAAAVNPSDGMLQAWDPVLDGANKGVWAIVLTSDHLLMGGGFTTIGGVKHRGFARFAGTP
jgi:hypothetical protein